MTQPMRIDIVPGRWYKLRMPASEAMMNSRLHGHIVPIRLDVVVSEGRTYPVVTVDMPGTGPWRGAFTDGEVGLYREGDEWYGYHPDLSETPEEIQACVEKVRQDLDVLLTNAGAVNVTWELF